MLMAGHCSKRPSAEERVSSVEWCPERATEGSESKGRGMTEPRPEDGGSTPAIARPSRAAVLLVAGVCSAFGGAGGAVVEDFEGAGSLVYFIPIHEDRPEFMEMIDRWLAGYVRRKLDGAREQGANCVVLEIDSFGGVVNDMLRICELLVSYPIPTCALVKTKAWSAAAGIALACDEIHMQKGSSIGAAHPVAQTKEGMKPLTEKYVSAVRTSFKSYAEAKGHSRALAEAMVDPDVEVVWASVEGANKVLYRSEFENMKLRGDARIIEVICGKEKLLTLTAEEAVKYGFAEGVVTGRAELLDALGYADARMVDVEMTAGERASRFVSGPWISGIFMGVGTIALFVAVYSTSATAAAVAAFAFGLFFWSQFVAGNASGLEMFVFFLGVILLGVEIFVLPGFGVAGVSGVGLILVSLVLALLPPGIFSITPGLGEWKGRALLTSLGTVFGALVGAGAGIVVLIRLMPRIPFLQRVFLLTGTGGEPLEIPRPPIEEAAKDLMGKEGLVVTTLRPGGKAEFGDEVLSVIADGEFIDSGARVKVIKVSGNRIVVTRA